MLIATLIAGFALSVALTAFARGYAARRGMLDQPGRRRSHTLPTPRGGGIGIVAATLLIGVPAWWFGDGWTHWAQPVAVAIAVLAVAIVGWRDDRAPLPVWPRVAVHAIAACLAGVAVLAPLAARDTSWWWLLLALAPLLAGFINAHNFMDGIDGLLGLQGVFVLAGIAALALSARDPALAALGLAGAAGCAGFLIFNHPPARVFMGDVGSGALGLAIGVAAALLTLRHPHLAWAAAILPSAFIVDSGLTLARRVAAGQRWYAPHRQHLYQWLVRVKWTHARTDATYLLWNLVVVAPLAWLAARRPALGAACFIAACGGGAIAWWLGKRACLAWIARSRPREAR